MSTSVPYRTTRPADLEPPKPLHLKKRLISVPCWQLLRHCRGTILEDMFRMTTVTSVVKQDIGRTSAPRTQGTTIKMAGHMDKDTGEEAEAVEEVEA